MLSKDKGQYLLACEASRYRLLALLGTGDAEPHTTAFGPAGILPLTSSISEKTKTRAGSKAFNLQPPKPDDYLPVWLLASTRPAAWIQLWQCSDVSTVIPGVYPVGFKARLVSKYIDIPCDYLQVDESAAVEPDLVLYFEWYLVVQLWNLFLAINYILG